MVEMEVLVQEQMQVLEAVALLEQALPVQPDTLASLVCTNTPAPESFASNLLSAPEKVLYIKAM